MIKTVNLFDRTTWRCPDSPNENHLVGYYRDNSSEMIFLTIDRLKEFRNKLYFHPFKLCPYCGSIIDEDILDDALNVRR